MAADRRAAGGVAGHRLSSPAVLPSLTSEERNEPNAHRFPMGDSTRLGLIAFLTQHESYHVGQAAFLRRQIGKPAMGYTRGSRSEDRAGAG
ncbi:MAG: hypothetical protein H0X69_11105 [Gemmatimonadales bacterium]|nr:hypothetical protein [Gemmatimonadales bacterium]